MKKNKAIITAALISVIWMFLLMSVEAEDNGEELVATDRRVEKDLVHHHSDDCYKPVVCDCDGRLSYVKTGVDYSQGRPVEIYDIVCSKADSAEEIPGSRGITYKEAHKLMPSFRFTLEEAQDYLQTYGRSGHRITVKSGITCGLEEGEGIGKSSLVRTKDMYGRDRMVHTLSGGRIKKVSAVIDKGIFERETNYIVSGGEYYVWYNENGKYTATYEWTDTVTGKSYSDSMYLVVLDIPVSLKYRDAGTELPDMPSVAYYGGSLPAVSVPQKDGYVFTGFYRNGVKYYGADGKPVAGADTKLLDMTWDFEAEWRPEEYSIRYGDRLIKVKYDSPYGALETDPGRAPAGYELDRLCLGDIMPYDKEGNPAEEKWKWNLTEEGIHTLSEVWKAKEYVLRYGKPGADGSLPVAGRVTYDAPYTAIAVDEWDRQTGYKLKGIYLGDEQVYDAGGKPVAAKWTGASEGSDIELCNRWEAQRYRIYHGPLGAGGKPAWHMEVTFGEPYAAVKIYDPGKCPGYTPEGLYAGDIRLFDGKGEPAGVWQWEFDEEELIPEVRYRANRGKIIFPDGKEEDIEFEKEYPDSAVPVPPDGMEFAGYRFGDEEVYDRAGKSAGKWIWAIEDGQKIRLSAVWKPKKYSIFFGPDNNGDGVGDLFISVTYGEDYPPIVPPVYTDGEIFEGFFINGEMVFDPAGRPTGKWHWDPEKYPIESRSRKEEAKEERDPDGGSDDADKGKEPDMTEDTETEETDVSDDGASEDDEAGGDRTGKKKKKDKRPKTEDGGADAADKGGEDPGDRHRGVTVDPESIKGTENGESVSGNAAGEDEKKGSGGKPGGRQKGKGAGNEADDKAFSEIGAQAGNTAAESGENKADTYSEPETAYSEVMKDSGSREEIRKQMKIKKQQKETEVKAQELAASTGIAATVKKVAKAGAVTAGTAAGIAAVYAGLIYLFGMAEVYSVCPDGKKKRLGKLAISEDKGGFTVSLSRNMLNECETDKLNMRLSRFFVSRYKNRDLIIDAMGRKQQEYIRRDIVVAV